MIMNISMITVIKQNMILMMVFMLIMGMAMRTLITITMTSIVKLTLLLIILTVTINMFHVFDFCDFPIHRNPGLVVHPNAQILAPPPLRRAPHVASSPAAMAAFTASGRGSMAPQPCTTAASAASAKAQTARRRARGRSAASGCAARSIAACVCQRRCAAGAAVDCW